MTEIATINWVEKYRPQVLEDIILSAETKKMLQTYIDRKTIPNFLFAGSAGIGKTTTALAIGKALDARVLFIPASYDNSVDVIRGKVKDFCDSYSFDKLKIVIIDEADSMSSNMCLDDNTFIKLASGENIKIGDMKEGVKYKVLSYDFDLKQAVADTASVVFKDTAECFEVELFDGRKIVATANHRFFIYQKDISMIIVKRLSDINIDNDMLIDYF